jgi:hypothetical protein
VVALGETPPPSTDLTEAQRAARAELEDFVQRATRLPTSPQAPEAEQYRATALAVLAVPYAQPRDNLQSRPATRPRPGPELPGADLPGDSRAGCTVVTGDDADRLWTAASDASVITAWKSGGATWNVTFRPLLPGERTCADLLPPI